ncbi:MAG: Hypothetical protein BHV28_00860 [Candidatus Tokpelaia hoelldobleri]|uniref:Uncharacterized protein n=1 Tax=Candidatus Tokpelaia hoelldobleri TaxID=1902579 RepID=A0A1U9JSH7_9HYPH|nr:MAG: Hypothetical protein BHV28_00860 [Candidatus Tokpelaia hoelldoblerii]
MKKFIIGFLVFFGIIAHSFAMSLEGQYLKDYRAIHESIINNNIDKLSIYIDYPIDVISNGKKYHITSKKYFIKIYSKYLTNNKLKKDAYFRLYELSRDRRGLIIISDGTMKAMEKNNRLRIVEITDYSIKSKCDLTYNKDGSLYYDPGMDPESDC